MFNFLLLKQTFPRERIERKNVLFTVEPLYNGHFGTSHFWVIFAVI